MSFEKLSTVSSLEWTKESEKRLNVLIVRHAGQEITADELVEFQTLVDLRRTARPARIAQRMIIAAKRTEVLVKQHVEFTPKPG